MTHLKELLQLAESIREVVLNCSGQLKGRSVNGVSYGGDAQFYIDNIAEKVALSRSRELFKNTAYHSEDNKTEINSTDKWVLIVDPIDGTRSAAAGLEMCTVSIAFAVNKKEATLDDVEEALIMELYSGNWVYANKNCDGIQSGGNWKYPIPNLNIKASLEHMFWSFELNGHPMKYMSKAYSHIVDSTANVGGVFIFNSSTFSILKIITGQLDAYVDIGNRILKDYPETREDFLEVGRGNVLHLFPYDIAAIVLIAKKAGVIITDAYGSSLEKTNLFESSWQNQQSCIAAATAKLHCNILNSIKWNDVASK